MKKTILNTRVIEECNLVTKFAMGVIDYVNEFMEKFKLLELEEGLFVYCTTFSDTKPINADFLSPEGCNDPEALENLRYRHRQRYEENMRKFKEVTEFKSELLSGKYHSDLTNKNGTILVFGKTFEIPRVEDYPSSIAVNHYKMFMNYLSVIVNTDYVKGLYKTESNEVSSKDFEDLSDFLSFIVENYVI